MITYNSCALCPRECRIDRSKVKGFCKQTDKTRIARAALHHWEEPCLSSSNGSGTVFFSGCTMRCCYCQNYEISQENKGYEITIEELADIFLMLRDKGAHNINLVSPTPFVPSIIEALDMVKPVLGIPIVYNCGGFESLETIKMLDGYVDIYLPDLKYYDNMYSAKYSHTDDYFQVAIEAICAMQRQVGKPLFNNNGLMLNGVIIRHLVLPTLRHDSEKLLKELAKRIKPEDIVLSVMSQYIPVYNASKYKELNRRISTFEYNYVLDIANELGFNGFSQERSASDELYIPEFEGKRKYKSHNDT